MHKVAQLVTSLRVYKLTTAKDSISTINVNIRHPEKSPAHATLSVSISTANDMSDYQSCSPTTSGGSQILQPCVWMT